MFLIIYGIAVAILIIYLSKNKFKNSISFKYFLSMAFIFIITTIFVYLLIINIPGFKTIAFQNNFNIYDNSILVLLSMSISILLNGLLGPITQKIHESHIINEYEKKYKFEEYEYYRDILQSESPAILSYCYNKQTNIEDIIVAVLLHLQMKKVIKLEHNKIDILENTYNMRKHEKYIIDNIHQISSNHKIFNKNFKETLIADLKENSYAEPVNSKNVNILFFMEFFMVWIIMFLLPSIPMFFAVSKIPVIAMLAYFLVFVELPLYQSIYKKINPIFRTQKALDLSGKLSGLKNYIIDFSNIKDNGTKNIHLYEEYVIYAIIFNIKGNLNNECKQIYYNFKNSSDFII